MTETPEPERLNQEGLAAFAARAGEDEPVVMLNLLRFKPDGGRAAYDDYARALSETFLARYGAAEPAPHVSS